MKCWLTNTDKGQAKKEIAKLSLGRDKDEELIIGDPKPTKTLSISQLLEMDMVGIYAIPKRDNHA